jgi:hypothetical protein
LIRVAQKMVRPVAGLAGLMMIVAGISGSAFAVDVPEIDPGSASAAITLVSGAVLWLTARRKG